MISGELLFLAWLLTYAIHSTVLLGGTWLVLRAFPKASMRMRDVMWKLALVGGPLSASFQLATEREPLGGNWTLSAQSTVVEKEAQRADSGHNVQFAAAEKTWPELAPRAELERAVALQESSEQLAAGEPKAFASAGENGKSLEVSLAVSTLPSFARRQGLDERTRSAGTNQAGEVRSGRGIPMPPASRTPESPRAPKGAASSLNQTVADTGVELRTVSARKSRQLAKPVRSDRPAALGEQAAVELERRSQRMREAFGAKPPAASQGTERNDFPIHLVHQARATAPEELELRAGQIEPVAGSESADTLVRAARSVNQGESNLEGPQALAQQVTAEAPHSSGILGYLERQAVQYSPRVLALWIAAALLGALLISISIGRLRRRLRSREVLESGPLFDLLEQLRMRSGLRKRVRLSISKELMAPITMGVIRPEICLPPRALEELESVQLQCILAHELGHIARRDPLWLMLGSAIQWCFFFQPLNRLARIELEEAAEFLADDWAVSHTRTGLELATSLTRVASWIVGARPLPAASMTVGVAGGSRLRRRVERLIHARSDAALPDPSKVSALALAGPLLVAWIVPGVSATGFSEPLEPPTAGMVAGNKPLLSLEASGLDAPHEAPDERAQARDEEVKTDIAIAPRSDTGLAFQAGSRELEADRSALDGTLEALHQEPANAPTQLLNETLRMLDAETQWLESELVQLRFSLAGLEEHEELLASLESVEARVERLKSRRARLEQLLPEITNLMGAASSQQDPVAGHAHENVRAKIPMGSLTR